MNRAVIGVAALALAAIAVAAPAEAKSDKAQGPPSGGETYVNNLSVPALFVAGADFRTMATEAAGYNLPGDCGTSPQAPGTDLIAADADGGIYASYWEQQTAATWMAECQVVGMGTVGVMLDWGDNLAGTTALKAGKVIRVEAGLLATSYTGMTGYSVTNISAIDDDTVLDRNAIYGVLSSGGAPATFASTERDSAAGPTVTRVWDHGATLSIARYIGDLEAWQSDVDEANWSTGYPSTFPATDFVAEMNSMGALVYGFNWGQKGDFAPAGKYRITVVAPHVTVGGVIDTEAATTEESGEDARNVMTYTDHSATIYVELAAKAGGGGGGRR